MTMPANTAEKITFGELFTNNPKLVGVVGLSAVAIFLGASQLPKIGADVRTQQAIDLAVMERDAVIAAVKEATKASGGVCPGQTVPFTVSKPFSVWAGGLGVNTYNYNGTAQINADGNVVPNVTRVTSKEGQYIKTEKLNMKPYPDSYGITLSARCGG